jgi:hypothetical protein
MFTWFQITARPLALATNFCLWAPLIPVFVVHLATVIVRSTFFARTDPSPTVIKILFPVESFPCDCTYRICYLARYENK